MDYLTNYGSAERVVPQRALRLPLSLVQKRPQKGTHGVIIGGRIFTAETERGVYYRDERTLKETLVYGDARIMSGVMAASESGFLVERETAEGVGGGIVSVAIPSLDVSVVCTESPIRRAATWGGPGFAILCLTEGLKALLGRFESGDCQAVWTLPYGEFAVAENRVIVRVRRRPAVVSADLESGEILWERSFEELGLSPGGGGTPRRGQTAAGYPHVFGDVIVLPGHSQQLAGLDLESGQRIWSHQTRGDAHFPVVYVDGRVYKVSGEFLTVLDARTGQVVVEERVQLPPETPSDAREMSVTFSDVADGYVFTGTRQGLLLVLNAQTANVEWMDVLEDEPQAEGSLISGNRLYVWAGDHAYIYDGQGGFSPD